MKTYVTPIFALLFIANSVWANDSDERSALQEWAAAPNSVDACRKALAVQERAGRFARWNFIEVLPHETREIVGGAISKQGRLYFLAEEGQESNRTVKLLLHDFDNPDQDKEIGTLPLRQASQLFQIMNILAFW